MTLRAKLPQNRTISQKAEQVSKTSQTSQTSQTSFLKKTSAFNARDIGNSLITVSVNYVSYKCQRNYLREAIMENTKKDLLELKLNGRSERDAVAEYLGLSEPSSADELIDGEIEVVFE